MGRLIFWAMIALLAAIVSHNILCAVGAMAKFTGFMELLGFSEVDNFTSGFLVMVSFMVIGSILILIGLIAFSVIKIFKG